MSLPGKANDWAPARTGLLTLWGLSPDADLVYRALVATGPQLRGALSRALGMAPRRVSAALDELTSVNAALTIPRQRSGVGGDARLWGAAPHESVLQSLNRRRNTPDLWERVRRHAALTARVGLPAWPDAGPAEPRLLSGIAQVRNRIAELNATERHEHLTISPEPALDAAVVQVGSPLDHDLLARGVAIRTLGVPAADGNAAAEHEREIARLGVQHRIADTLPVKLMIFDHRVALLPFDPLNPARGAIEVDGRDIVRGLVEIFGELWDAARPPAVSGNLDVDLTPRECAFIELLAAGHSDSTTAMRTRTSLRTVRYTLSDLMDRLGVENRFQLGLALGTLGVRPANRPFDTPRHQETT